MTVFIKIFLKNWKLVLVKVIIDGGTGQKKDIAEADKQEIEPVLLKAVLPFFLNGSFNRSKKLI